MLSTASISAVLATVLSLSALCIAQNSSNAQPGAYKLTDDLTYMNFFDSFDFFDGPDPTHGFVQFQNLTSAIDKGLIGYLEDTQSVFMGVDYKNKAPDGRASVRLESKKKWNHGLMIADIRHMPNSQCGLWPAMWALGTADEWPRAGEIDINEGVNDSEQNAVTLHTSKGCLVDNTTSLDGTSGATGSHEALFTGLLTTSDCDVASEVQAKNVGCSVLAPKSVSNVQMGMGSDNTATDLPSYGTNFNKAGGGIYAMERTSKSISVWFIPRSSVIFDTQFSNTTDPNPAQWGKPIVHFAGSGCDFDQRFRDLMVIFDITFCGEWAGKIWGDSCAAKTGIATCEAYVRDSPDIFKEAYWEVAGLRWYQKDTASNYKRGSPATFVKAKSRYYRG
jgi:hypothetical protein